MMRQRTFLFIVALAVCVSAGGVDVPGQGVRLVARVEPQTQKPKPKVGEDVPHVQQPGDKYFQIGRVNDAKIYDGRGEESKRGDQPKSGKDEKGSDESTEFESGVDTEVERENKARLRAKVPQPKQTVGQGTSDVKTAGTRSPGLPANPREGFKRPLPRPQPLPLPPPPPPPTRQAPAPPSGGSAQQQKKQEKQWPDTPSNDDPLHPPLRSARTTSTSGGPSGNEEGNDKSAWNPKTWAGRMKQSGSLSLPKLPGRRKSGDGDLAKRDLDTVVIARRYLEARDELLNHIQVLAHREESEGGVGVGGGSGSGSGHEIMDDEEN